MSDYPQRIQLRRTKGWRKPPGTIVVTRSTRWGNPLRVVPYRHPRSGRTMYRVTGSVLDGPGGGPAYADPDTARHFAAQGFKWDFLNGRFGDTYPSLEEIHRELAGHDLACWCPVRLHPNGTPHWGDCHADVLIDLANGDYRAIVARAQEQA